MGKYLGRGGRVWESGMEELGLRGGKGCVGEGGEWGKR